jgi:hypothetical protein
MSHDTFDANVIFDLFEAQILLMGGGVRNLSIPELRRHRSEQIRPGVGMIR